jgi:GrpB-like predicted nucleotidyltransferase (UPF0157 family)
MSHKVGPQRPRPPEVNRVVPYAPSWPDQFEAIRRRIAPALDGMRASVEHIGSTAVPGLVAKPIVDIDVVLEAAADLPDAIDRLEALGYVHQGDLGVVGREAFDGPRELSYLHLYVVVDGSTPHQDHILLRDYLRQHPEAAARYSARKLEVAHLITDESRQAYLEAKASIVEELLARAREWHPRTPSDS